MGVFKVSFKHYPGVCKRVKGANYGSEAMTWTSDGLVFISSGLSFPDLEEHYRATNSHSEIQLFDFRNPAAGVTNLKIIAKKDFDVSKMRPHGLSVLEDKGKKEYHLYVVNHQYGEILERVEKFKFDPKTRHLTHIQSFMMEEVSSANDVTVLAQDQFYVSNFMLGKDNALLTFLQFLVPLRLGGIFFYDGTKTTEVADGLVTPNGHCLSKDKKFLYVVSTLEESLIVFKRDTVTNALKQVQTVALSNKGDNINLSQNGDALLIGAHPMLYKTMTSMASPLNPNCTSPSSVLRVPLKQDGLVEEADITELFYDHGDLISGSSSAVQYDGQLLIGSIVNSLVHCQL
ncbi:serum paraoxonase/arylesterase 2 [Elysia marginata]|uniref:Paraoxonase n=1 Tax=Elysia marginata TaxID=1093978 RepID=A0AAV4IHM4_9GAST|nr:serum paraoxonase/arylesterase 2 [Elysia marginata]